MANIVIEVLQGSAVTQTMLGGITTYLSQLQVSYSVHVYMPKIMKVGWQYIKILQ